MIDVDWFDGAWEEWTGGTTLAWRKSESEMQFPGWRMVSLVDRSLFSWSKCSFRVFSVSE